MGTPHGELPEVTAVQRIEVRPGDRFVLSLARVTSISETEADDLKATAAAALGVDRDRILLLAGGVSLTVIGPAGEDAAPV